MSSQEENLELVREGIEAFRSGDIERFLQFLDPEIEVFSTPQLANPTRATGRDAWLRWIGEWLEAWETFEIEAASLDPLGEHHVVAEMRQRGRGKGSGVEVDLRVFYMFEVHGAVATRYHLYPTREEAEAEALAGERRSPSD